MKRLALLLLISTCSWADDFFVEKATGSAGTETDLATLSELIRTSVSESGSHGTASSSGKADYVLRPKLLKLGKSYVVTLDKLKDDKVRFSTQLKASTLDELDLVATRLTRAVIDEVAAGTDTRVGEVTETEALDGANRRPTRNGYYIGIGPAVMANLGTTAIAYLFNGGYSWDTNKAMLKINLDFAAGGGAEFFDATLAGNIFLDNQDTSPFINVGFGFGASDSKASATTVDESVSGFALTGGGGYQFLRTSSVNVEIGGGITAILRSKTNGIPMLFGLKVALHF